MTTSRLYTEQVERGHALFLLRDFRFRYVEECGQRVKGHKAGSAVWHRAGSETAERIILTLTSLIIRKSGPPPDLSSSQWYLRVRGHSGESPVVRYIMGKSFIASCKSETHVVSINVGVVVFGEL